jgi:hypothetical protein
MLHPTQGVSQKIMLIWTPAALIQATVPSMHHTHKQKRSHTHYDYQHIATCGDVLIFFS